MWKDFKPVLKMLLRFVLLYVVLVGAYQLYLNGHRDHGLDPLSDWVMRQVAMVQEWLGYTTLLVPGQPLEETTYFYMNGQYVTRMVEGCNAVSVIILFLAFIFAFYSGLRTFLFALGGVFILHIINVLRIAGLNLLVLHYPHYTKIGHDYFFPAIIYGTVVLLWLLWIKGFVLKSAAK